MRAYARQAKNKGLEADAVEIRVRAERRLGDLIIAQKQTVGLNRGRAGAGRPRLGGSAEEPPIADERPTLAEAGIDKKLSSRAQKLAAVPDSTFEAKLDGLRQRIVEEGERVSLDLLKEGDKAQQRAAREAALGERITALPGRKYGVILADPEWRFEPWSRETGMDRAADNHYPTSSLDVIRSRPVADIAADDAVLFLWATVPMLPHALSVMEAWGFDYRSHLVWRKDRLGTGYWFRNKHEILLVGVRGDVPAPAPGTQWPSLVEAPVSQHSAKPEAFLELIEAYFPTVPKIELNRRGAPRPGWDAWGNEVEPSDESSSYIAPEAGPDALPIIAHPVHRQSAEPGSTRRVPSQADAGNIPAFVDPRVTADAEAYRRAKAGE